MLYCTEDEVRGMIKDDALNTLIGDAYIEEPERREELLRRSSRRRSRTRAARSTVISQRGITFPSPGLRRF